MSLSNTIAGGSARSAGKIAAGRSGLASSVFRAVFSFPSLLGGLLVAAVFVAARLGIEDGDTWWHVATGERILALHRWPSVDPFSFTVAGRPWLPYEWLGEVLMAVAVRIGGLRGLTGGMILLAGLFFVLIFYFASLRSGSPKSAFIACAALLPLAAVFFTFRPQFFGYIFLVSTLILLERYRQGLQRSLWALPVIFLLWVNTHGSFVFGLLAFALYIGAGFIDFEGGSLEAERWSPSQLRHLGTVFVFSVMALAVTPYGLRVALNPLDMMVAQPVNIANIREWQSMPFGMWRGKLFLVLLLAFFLAQVVLRLRYHLAEFALFLFTVYAACVHARFLILFVMVFAPLLAMLLARWVPAYEPRQDRRALNAVLMLLIGAAIFVFFPTRGQLEAETAEFYPASAVRYLQEHPAPQPMLNEYAWGGYLIWSFEGRRPVFIDGRADIYESAGVLSDYLRITRLDPETLALLRKYNIQSCLLKRDAPLATLLAVLPDWKREYEDKVGILYVRTPAASAQSPASR